MNLNTKDHEEQLRRIVDELINKRHVAQSNHKRGHEALGWTFQKFTILEEFLDLAIRVIAKAEHLAAVTFVLVVFLLGALTVVIWKASTIFELASKVNDIRPKGSDLRPGPERAIDSEQAPMTNQRPLVSTNLVEPTTESSSSKRIRKAHPVAVRTVYLPPTLAENRENQSPSRVIFPIGVPIGFTYDVYGRLNPRPLQPSEKIQVPPRSPMRGGEGLQVNQKSFSQGR